VSNKAYERLSTEQRRRQLLEVGCELFAHRPYDEVWVDHVAAHAGVSRGLLYHYFGSKRGFLHAVVERETARMRDATQPDSRLPPPEQLRLGLDAYLAYVQSHPHGYRALFRGAPGSDSTVRALVDDNLRHQAARILLALGREPEATPPLLRLAVRGWLSFVIATALDWLDAPEVGPDALRDLWVRALVDLLTAAGVEVPDGPTSGPGPSSG
jgi:AcrR family transcriptional regulator